MHTSLSTGRVYSLSNGDTVTIISMIPGRLAYDAQSVETGHITQHTTTFKSFQKMLVRYDAILVN